MSFFKELKEDIVQSVNELSDSIEEKVSEAEEIETVEENKTDEKETLEREVQKEIDSLLEDGSLLEDMPVPEEEQVLEPLPVEEESLDETQEEEVSEEVHEEEIPEETEETLYDNTAYVQEESNMNDMEEMSGADKTDETTVITKGTTINGGIKSDTSLLVKGVIEGDVECLGKLTITGRVAGNSTASEIYVNTPKLEGNLESRGSVKIDVGTVVIGSVSSASVVVAGAIKGDIEVNGPVIVDSTAVVKGNIIAKSIQINSGAVIDGFCSLKYADVDLDSFFE